MLLQATSPSTTLIALVNYANMAVVQTSNVEAILPAFNIGPWDLLFLIGSASRVCPF
jgi:hypothetical protein